MKILKSDLDLDNFFQQVAVSEKRLLLLDYDGTLAPFHIKRDEALPYPGILEELRAIIDSERTRLVMISGRPIADLVPLLDLDPPPEIWGSHGWERLLPDNCHIAESLEKTTVHALEQIEANLEKEGLASLSERKHGCLALHWRGANDSKIEELRDRFLSTWSDFAEKRGLSLIEFDGGIEIRARGRDKAFVVRKILSEMGSGTVSAFLGDDMTDEEAFEALEGKSLRVLVRNELRSTAADVWLRPPDEVIDFLRRWAITSILHDNRHHTIKPLPGMKGELT